MSLFLRQSSSPDQDEVYRAPGWWHIPPFVVVRSCSHARRRTATAAWGCASGTHSPLARPTAAQRRTPLSVAGHVEWVHPGVLQRRVGGVDRAGWARQGAVLVPAGVPPLAGSGRPAGSAAVQRGGLGAPGSTAGSWCRVCPTQRTTSPGALTVTTARTAGLVSWVARSAVRPSPPSLCRGATGRRATGGRLGLPRADGRRRARNDQRRERSAAERPRAARRG